ncbi:MAG: 50S ribosomal protein L34e [Candidatus Woesearchaeota archaeon]|nr:MAG: 50S ribosomal protein L34e [Candidatus Woesearchaeota archaeon]
MARVRKVRKTPTGKKKIVFKRKQHRKSHCSLCKKVIHGVKRGGSKGPNRKYGGELCSACSRKVLKIKAKFKNKTIEKGDIPISLRKYM